MLPPLSLTTIVLDQGPTIVTAATGTGLTLSWPLVSAGFTLQSRSNLMSGSWVTNSLPAPQIVGTNYQVTVPATNQAQFFRLSR
jgi:hypothetical protein